MTFRYVDHTQRGQVNLANQVNYGPTAHLNPGQIQALGQHYGVRNRGQNAGRGYAETRITQYNTRHMTYVRAAQATGRGLTIQERQALRRNGQASNASINHIIASGTGQNIINHETLRFQVGRAQVNQHLQTALAQPQNLQQAQQVQGARLNVLQGIARQAAAVGRTQGYSRAIINERGGEQMRSTVSSRRIYGANQVGAGNALNVGQTRNRALQLTLTAFQGGGQRQRYRSYRDLLNMTYDSPGNLRVGDSYGNNLVSTGFDAPLDANRQMTGRARRLAHAHLSDGPDRLLTQQNLVTRDTGNNILSSSMHRPPRRLVNPLLQAPSGPKQSVKRTFGQASKHWAKKITQGATKPGRKGGGNVG